LPFATDCNRFAGVKFSDNKKAFRINDETSRQEKTIKKQAVDIRISAKKCKVFRHQNGIESPVY